MFHDGSECFRLRAAKRCSPRVGRGFCWSNYCASLVWGGARSRGANIAINGRNTSGGIELKICLLICTMMFTNSSASLEVILMPLGYDPMNMPGGMLCLGEVLGSVADLREAQSSIPSLLE